MERERRLPGNLKSKQNGFHRGCQAPKSCHRAQSEGCAAAHEGPRLRQTRHAIAAARRAAQLHQWHSDSESSIASTSPVEPTGVVRQLGQSRSPARNSSNAQNSLFSLRSRRVGPRPAASCKAPPTDWRRVLDAARADPCECPGEGQRTAAQGFKRREAHLQDHRRVRGGRAAKGGRRV